MQPCGDGAGCQVLVLLGWTLDPWTSAFGRAANEVGDRFPALWPIVAGAVGSVVASLSGLLVDRLPRINGWGDRKAEPGLTLSRPASHCEDCGHPIPLVALVPVAGWFLASGKCGSCGSKVPIIYPAVEAVVALLSMSVVVLFGVSSVSLLACLAIWILVLVSWLDWKEQVIPDGLSVPLFFLGLLLSPFEPDAWARGAGAFLVAASLWGTFSLVSSMKKVDAMATGDIALGAALGAWVGVCAMPAFLLCATGAYMAYSVPLRLRNDQVWVPMGPALAVGFVIVALTGIKFNI